MRLNSISNIQNIGIGRNQNAKQSFGCRTCQASENLIKIGAERHNHEAAPVIEGFRTLVQRGEDALNKIGYHSDSITPHENAADITQDIAIFPDRKLGASLVPEMLSDQEAFKRAVVTHPYSDSVR